MHSLVSSNDEAKNAFIFSRIFLLLITLPVIAIAAGKAGFPFDPTQVTSEVLQHNSPFDLQTYLLAWWRWDNVFYVRIAALGYHHQPGLTVFFPLWPATIRLLGYPLSLFLPGETAYYISSIILSNLLFFVSLQLLYRLTNKYFDAALAKTAVWLLAFFPYTIFFSFGYTESLFLFFCLATFVFLERGRKRDWWLASLCAGLAATTRETGAVIIVALFVCFLQHYWPLPQYLRSHRREMINALCSLLIIPLGVVIYMLYLYLNWHNPLLFLHDVISWGRHPVLPLTALFSSLWYLITFVVPLDSLYNNLLDLCFTILPIILLIKYWRRLPLYYSVFALSLLLYSLSTAVDFPNPLMSIPRYLMVIFPCIILLAVEWKQNPACHRYIIIFFPLTLAVNVVLFAIGRWVA
ncbi:mannosyltransferase family protein [Dictyobacter arantiisoli]|uniref:Membrane protein n=1 Tax=Dictyobacter arantiisoli TaxID=2014874 RepID=A0A5A5TJZ8_9CHLR|nr:mannosyltransferase family protein [Dictyobacter arantiisoli]GCF11951.1 membrane protein [Dictyobacter arantiisoli]